MMLVGFLGCCGAVQESQCMLGLVSVPSVPTAPGVPGCPPETPQTRGRDGAERVPIPLPPSPAPDDTLPLFLSGASVSSLPLGN